MIRPSRLKTTDQDGAFGRSGRTIVAGPLLKILRRAEDFRNFDNYHIRVIAQCG